MVYWNVFSCIPVVCTVFNFPPSLWSHLITIPQFFVLTRTFGGYISVIATSFCWLPSLQPPSHLLLAKLARNVQQIENLPRPYITLHCLIKHYRFINLTTSNNSRSSSDNHISIRRTWSSLSGSYECCHLVGLWRRVVCESTFRCNVSLTSSGSKINPARKRTKGADA